MSLANAALAQIDVVVLAGGRGERLGALAAGLPKPLVPVGGRPFLDILVDALAAAGARRFIVCAGHLADRLVAHCRGRRDVEFAISIEPRPLGTGGALRLALPMLRSKRFLVVNGDSICRLDYDAFTRFHRDRGSELSLVLGRPDARTDAGRVTLDADARLRGFAEKAATAGAAHLNAGIYLFEAPPDELLAHDGAFSLERDLLPVLVARRHCFGFAVDAEVLDIGTPERLARAQTLLAGG